MAIIIYENSPGKIKQSFLFKDDLNKIHEALDDFKKGLNKLNCTFIASVVESIDDDFIKNDINIHDPMFH